MGLRSLFQGKGPAATNTPQTFDAPQTEPSSPEQAALSAEQAKDLTDAWAELNEAAEQSEVLNFHTCARPGQSWTENPAAVRALTAVLPDLPKDGQQIT